MRKPHPLAAGDSASPTLSAPVVGRIVGTAARGQIRVEFRGSGGPLPARLTAGLSARALAEAARERREVLLVFDENDPRKPIVLALFASATPNLDLALAGESVEGARDARVDGKRVEIEGREEVVLRCGKASLTLRRDGSVEIQGVRIKTAASQVQRIRGAKVQVN